MALAPPIAPGAAALLVQRYEVTAAEFEGRAFGDGAPDLPAVWMSWQEAADWAAQRSMRLPTLEEWRRLAGGAGRPSRRIYPWGNAYSLWNANTLSLGMHRPLPVGTFESGRVDVSEGDYVYDLGGNVREWVDASTDPSGRQAACGGSFAADEEAAEVARALWLNPGDRASDLGFRCVAPAADWLLERVVPLWRQSSESDRAHILRAFSVWDAGLRAGLAEELRARGAPADICDALTRPQP